MITASQLRMARAHLNVTQSEVSKNTGVSVPAITSIEGETTKNPKTSTLHALKTYYEAKGIEFTDDNGLRPASARFRHLKGTDGFRSLMDDVYEQANLKGGKIRLWNARPAFFIEWLGKDWYEKHTERMKPLLENISFNVTCEEGDTNFIGGKFAEYRWVPKQVFNEQAIYCYGDRIAFLTFSEGAVDIYILYNQEFYNSFCLLFDFVWDQITIIPDSGDYKP
jgi:transcriptional regulator with XRE-family HTH domain